VITREGDRLVNRAYRGPLPVDVVLSRPVGISAHSSVWREMWTGAAGIINDVWDETPAAQVLRRAMGEEYLRTTASYLRCWLGVPLIHKGELVGALALTHQTPGYFTERHAALAAAIANQVAAAIANARLYDEAQQRTQELSTLLDVSNILASTLDLRSLLDRLLDHLESIVEHDGCAVAVVDGDELVTLGARKPSLSEVDATRGLRMPLSRIAHFWDRLPRREPVIIPDVTDDSPDAIAYRSVVTERAVQTTHSYVRSWMAVPMALQDRVIGMLSVRSHTPDLYTERDARLAAAIANQLAVAIENARLYERAQHAAVLEERQRLARELHDSVSQALFGISLGSRSAQKLIEQGQGDRALRSVEYVVGLADTGMAEMRALIFELQPESLATEGLVAALSKQAEAVRALQHQR
jgi:GAF domain-containing protein